MEESLDRYDLFSISYLGISYDELIECMEKDMGSVIKHSSFARIVARRDFLSLLSRSVVHE